VVDPDIEQQMAKFAPSSNPSIDTGSDIDPDAAAIAKAVLPQGASEARRVGPPDIDPDAAAIANAKQNALRSTMYGVAGQNPDQAAEAQRIGREFGVSGEFVLRNMEDMRRMQAIRSVERRELMQQDPILARFLTNQDFAALAHDDLDNLSATERIYKNAVDFVNPKSWDTIKGRFQRGMDLVEMGRANDVMGLRAQWSPTARSSAEIAEEMKILPTDGGIIGSTAEVLGQMVGGIPEVVETTMAGTTLGGGVGLVGGPLAPATVPAGMALGATAGLATGMARVAAMSEAGNALQEMRTHAYGEIERLMGEGYSREQATQMVGYDDATAQNFAMGVGILNGLIETASFEVMGPVARRLVGNVIREKVSEAVIRPTMRGAVMQFAKDYRNAVLTEGGEEFLQQWVGIIGDEMQRKYGSNLPSRFDDEGSVKAAIVESFEAALEGVKGAMLIGGVGPTGNLYFDMKRARQSVRQQAFFNRLTDVAKNSKVRQRDTPAYEKFIEGQVEGKDIDTVYIDAQQLNGVLRQAEVNGVATAAELDQLLPGVRQQLAEALETNGDVTVPMSVWQARVSGTKVGDALLPHVRLAPDAWSVNERLQWEKKRAALMQEAEELLDEQEKKDTKARSAAAQIEDSIKEQLVQSGAMDDKAAATNAKFYRSLVIVMADKAGMTPEQFHEQYGMRVFGVRDQQASETANQGGQFDQVSLDIIAQLNDDELRQLIDYAYEVNAIQSDIDALETELDRREVEDDDPSGGEEKEGGEEEREWTGIGLEELMRQAAQQGRRDNLTPEQLGASIRNDGDFAVMSQSEALASVTDAELGQEAYDALALHEQRINHMRKRLVAPSRLTPNILEQVASIDRAYMAAVKNGDLALAQRMVLDAAKAAGFNALAHHGTDARPFTVFGENDSYNWGQAFYFSPNLAYAQEYAENDRTGQGFPRVMNVALNLGRVFSPESNPQHLKLYRQWAKEQERTGKGHGAFFVNGPIKEPYGDTKARNVIDYEDQWWIVERIWEAGFDSFTTSESDGQTIAWGVKHPNQVKLIDPITKDENGKVIPLSKRFDLTKPSMLFQMAAQLDAEHAAAVASGNMELAQRLVDAAAERAGFTRVGFHGTRAEFTPDFAFDPNRIGSANDAGFYGRGFYFVNSSGEAAYYGRNVGQFYLRMSNPLDVTNRSGDLTYEGHFLSWAQILEPLGLLKPEYQQALDSRRKLDAWVEENARVIPWSAMGRNNQEVEGFIAKIADPRPWNKGYEITGRFAIADAPSTPEQAKANLKAVLFDELSGYAINGELIAPDYPNLALGNTTLSDYIRTEGMAQELSNAAKKAGYDSILAGDEMVVFEPEQIKAAAPDARDEQGNLIPLSKRFNIKSKRVFEQAAKPSNTLGDFIEMKIGMKDADFYIVRRGTKEAVGTPTKEYNPEHIGVRVTRTDLLLPDYLFYMMQYVHGRGYFAQRATGTTKLVNIKTSDIAQIAIGNQQFQQSVIPANFYSTLARHIGGMNVDLTAQSWKERLQGLINKGAIKESEVEWSGIREWLDLHTPQLPGNRISNLEIMDFLAREGIQVTRNERVSNVEELVREAAINAANDAENDLKLHGKLTPEAEELLSSYRVLQEAKADRQELAEVKSEIDALLYKAFRGIASRANGPFTDFDTYIEERYEGGSEGKATKWENWKTGGGTNYREILLTLDEQRDLPSVSELRDRAVAAYHKASEEERNLVDAHIRKIIDSEGVSFAYGVSKNFVSTEDFKEGTWPAWITEWRNETQRVVKIRREKPYFQGKHWSESNVIVHIRTTDRVTADGKRILFIEEIQSDWAQRAADEGFVGQKAEDLDKIKQLEEQYRNAPSQQLADRITRLNKRLSTGQYNISPGPFVETTDAWLSLAIKQIIMEAVNGRYDGVMIINGKQANDLYSQEEQVESIEVMPHEPGEDGSYGRHLTIKLKAQKEPLTLQITSRGRISSASQNRAMFVGEPLSAVVGKEMAERIMDVKNPALDAEGVARRSEILRGYSPQILEALNRQQKVWSMSDEELGFVEQPFNEWLQQGGWWRAADYGEYDQERYFRGTTGDMQTGQELRSRHAEQQRNLRHHLRNRIVDEANQTVAALRDESNRLADAAYQLPQMSPVTFTGKDIKIGGKGLAAFYDQLVPIAVGKMIKKYGGGEVEVMSLAAQNGKQISKRDAREVAKQYIDGSIDEAEVLDELGIESEMTEDQVSDILGGPHGDSASRNAVINEFVSTIAARTSGQRKSKNNGFVITEAMRDKVMPGLPLFQLPKFNLYSALAQQVAAMPDKPMSAETWNQQIKSWLNKGLIKRDELEWTGLEDYLAMQEGKIAKATVMSFLNNEGVQVQRVRLGEFLAGDARQRQRAAEFFGMFRDKYGTVTIDGQEMFDDDIGFALQDGSLAVDQLPVDLQEPARLWLAAADNAKNERELDRSGPARFNRPDLVLPGGLNYREVLLTLPPETPGIVMSENQALPDEPEFYELSFANMKLQTPGGNLRGYVAQNDDGSWRATFQGSTTYRDSKQSATLWVKNEMARIAPRLVKQTGFEGTHWEGIPNVVVHLRLTDRVDENGKTVLFVEEVQSDWGQKGRKKGFVDNQQYFTTARRLEVLQVSKSALWPQVRVLLESVDNMGFDTAAEAMRFIYDIRVDPATGIPSAVSEDGSSWELAPLTMDQVKPIQDYVVLENEARKLRAYVKSFEGSIPAAPFVENTDGWLNLGLKQVLLEAVRGQYDRVAFITGEQSAARYSLEYRVKRIVVTPRTSAVSQETMKNVALELANGRMLELTVNSNGVVDKVGSEIGEAGQAFVGEQLDDVIGKEMASKVMQAERGTFEGDDLKVGGEGMKAFYNSIVPAAMNKLLKKLGKDKLGTMEMRSTRSLEQFDIEEYAGAWRLVDRANNQPVAEAPVFSSGADAEAWVKQNAQPTTHMAVDLTPELVAKIASQGGFPLFQAALPESARGGFDPRRMALLLGEKADLSTFLHESAHWYLTVLSQLAADPTATDQVKNDMNTLLAWFGVPDLATWNRMTLDEQRKYHEQFAYNFEIYISQGVAPSVALEGMFERFAAWLKNVYASIRDELNAIYRREYGQDLPIMTGEVRQVMDRMLASERQIREAEAIREMKPMFLTQEESGMDDATWKAYQDMVEEATQAAITDMTKASVRQMQWLSGARAKILRDLQARHRKLRKAMREEVTEQVRRSPLYRAMAFIRTGKSINADGTAIKALGLHRLDMDAVRAMYPEGTPGMPDITALGTGGRGMMGVNGLPPDTLAELFGYSSGDELVRALIAAKPMREEINRIVDDRMLKEHGELSDPEQMEVVVQKALHNEARARFVAVELRFVTKATEPARIMVGAAKQAAKEILGRKRLRDIKAGQFEAAESKAARDAQTAYGRRQTPDQIGKAAFTRAYNEAKDNGADDATATATATAKAAQAIARATERQKEYQERYGNRNPQEVIVRAKRAQLINNQLAGQAAAATEEIAKKVRYLRRVLNAENVKKIGAEHADQIAQLLEKFDLAQRSLKAIDTRTRFAEWLESKRAEGIEPEIPLSLAGVEKTNYKNLTLNDFRDLVMAVQQLEFMGKNHRKVLLAAQQKQFEEQRDEIVQSIKDNAKGRKSKARSARNDQERRRQGLKGFAASHLNVATIVRILDGGKDNGPLWRYLIRTANERADMETTMRAKATETLAAIFKPILAKDKMGGKGMFFDSVNDSFNLESRMVIALNMGNAGNMQRLLDGEGWTMEQIRPILESLTKEQWEAVQKVWDFLESYRPLIAEKERRIYGKEPEWVEPQPITVVTKDGATLTLRGGYYPIKYDPRASRRSESLELAEAAKRDMAAAFSSATTRRTFTKNRSEKVVNRPLMYTLDAMYNGVSDVIHDLSWHEWLIDANRLERSDLFYDAINTTYGNEFVSQIRAWIKDVAAGEQSAQHSLEVALAFGRRNIGLMQMGMNLMSGALQVTGYAQSVVRVGAKWMGRGMSKTFASPKAANELVNSKSTFMANRGRTQFREIAEIKNMIRDQSGAMRSIHANAYILMLFMQRTVDVPTWIGAYEKARAEAHDEATAVALADQAVIDSQGSGMLKDLAKVQRGGEFVKTFTMFYGYFNTTFNLAVAQTMTARSKGKMLSDWFMLFVVPAMMSEALRRMLVPRRDDEDDDDPTMLARELAASQLSYLMGTMVGVREFSDVVPKRLFGVPARGYSGPASLRGVTIVADVVGEVVDFEADRQFRKAIITAIGIRTGIPAVQINRTIDGLDAIISGDTNNPAAVLFGTRK